MFSLSDEEFEKVVSQAIDDLPDEFRSKLDNVDIVIETSPPPEVRRRFPRNRLILGLYQGVPQKKRTVGYGLVLPDKISLYKRNIELVSSSREEIHARIRKTLLHEIGHHFSLSDKDLRRMGW